MEEWPFAFLFSPVSSFTGNIAKFIGLRFAMIFYASRPVILAGPTHGGPRRHPIRLGRVQEVRAPEQASNGLEGNGDARHNLAIIPLFIPVRPLLSAT